MVSAESFSLPCPLPPRPVDGHKGTFGRVLIIAGSRGMSGAACLCGQSALRGGAGLVTVACPLNVQPIVSGFEPSCLTAGLPETADGQLDITVLDRLSELTEKQNAVAIGPGLGDTSDVQAIVRRLYEESPVPLVIDADGLNVLSTPFQEGRLTKSPPGPRILTPHPGEFGRLSGLSIKDIQSRREDTAREFAGKNGVTLVLKGPATVITDGERLEINSTGNSGMATGGSGDVLTGLLGALQATDGDAFELTRLGVYLHGLAGDLAAEEMSEQGMIASDLPRFLCEVWKRISPGTPSERAES